MARDESLGGRKRKRSKSLRVADTARDKARIPTQAAARDVMDDVIQHGDKRRTAKQRIDRLGLSDAELRDLSSYSRGRSNQSMDEVHDRTWGRLDEAIGLTTGVKPSDAWWSYTNPTDRLMGRGRAAEQTAAPALAFFPFGRAGKAAEDVVGGAGGPAPYVSKDKEFRGSVPDEAWEQGYLYHRTSPDRLDAIRKSGLTPAKPAGDNPAGVYFANHPLQAVGLAWKYRNGSYVRVRRDKVTDLEERAFGESRVPGSVAPDDLEYLGADGLWHPVGSTPSERIVAALPAAKVKRREQEKLSTAERRERAAKVEEALKLGGEAGERAALAQLKGELPKLKLGDGLKDFDQAAFQDLLTHIGGHDALRPFEKVATQRALRRLVEGTVPTRSEIKLLERAFGPDLAAQIAESSAFWQKAGNMGLSVINVPRAMMATLDISAPFRQGLVLGAAQPRLFAKSWDEMLKSFTSENAYMDVMDEIASRPTFKKMEEGRLQLTDFESLSTREEGFQSNLAETLTGGKRSPVRMSGRAYSAFLNKFRADAFDNYLRMAEEAGHDINDPHLLRSIASWVNTATGRGSIKALEGAMTPMSALFFSPRLIASRLQLLNPVYYARLHPFARKEALKGARNLLGAISMTLFMAKQAGADVELDPRSSDFGKIKVGDTRVDITGGLQAYVVNAYRVLKGETVSSTTGELVELEGGFATPSRADILANFAGNKLAPVPQYARGWLNNESFAGDPFDPAREAGKLFVPIGAGSTYEAYQQGGPGLAALTAGLGSVGFGVLTYGAEPKKGGSSRKSSRSIRRSSSRRSRSLRRN